MKENFIRINKKLLPLSWFYGLGVGFRNLLFEMNVLKEHAYDIPVVSVGNITVGGTGKTPHVEYLIRLLKDQIHVAVLSRGYKRKSRGFIVADADTPMRDIGDEPYQMKQKFPEVVVAVDKKRTRGITKLTSVEYAGQELDAILLDDAFQHRYVKPGLNILLVDYHRLIIYDKLLPAGRLREPVKAKDRADIVIVTKCPKTLNPMEFRVLTKQMNLYPYQQLFFTTLDYESLHPLFEEATTGLPDSIEDLKDKHVLLLTGIASPKQMYYDLKDRVASLQPLSFSDHHNFKKKDVHCINEAFETLPSPKVIITTEKDATRLKGLSGLSDKVRQNLLILPVRITFMQGGEEAFDNKIIGYIRKNSKNSILIRKRESSKSKKADTPSGEKPLTISFKNNK